jgi:hypothetical protein
MVNGLRQCGMRELHLLLIQFAEMKTVKQSSYRHNPREPRSQQCSTLHLRPPSMARVILQHSVGGQTHASPQSYRPLRRSDTARGAGSVMPSIALRRELLSPQTKE